MKRTIETDSALKLYKIKINDEALTYIANACDGDVRSALFTNKKEIEKVTIVVAFIASKYLLQGKDTFFVHL